MTFVSMNVCNVRKVLCVYVIVDNVYRVCVDMRIWICVCTYMDMRKYACGCAYMSMCARV